METTRASVPLIIIEIGIDLIYQKQQQKLISFLYLCILLKNGINSYLAIKAYQRWLREGGYPKIDTNEFHQKMIRCCTFNNNYQSRT